MIISKNAATKGQAFLPESAANIEETRAAGQLTINLLYQEKDGQKRTGRAVMGNLIDWEMTVAQLVPLQNAIDTERQERIAADLILTGAIATEQAARIQGDATVTTAFQAADAAMQTALTAAMNAAVDALRDTTVADIIPVAYQPNSTLTLASIMGANRPDGIYGIPFTSDDVLNTATVTTDAGQSFPISFGDMLRVKINGGVVESTTLVDDLDRQKFIAIDGAITALQAAVTASAIRAHFSGSTFVTITNGKIEVVGLENYDILAGGTTRTLRLHLENLWQEIQSIYNNALFSAKNGLTENGTDAELGGLLTRHTTIESTQFELNLYAKRTTIQNPFFPIFDIVTDANGGLVSRTESNDVRGLWFSRSVTGDIELNYTGIVPK